MARDSEAIDSKLVKALATRIKDSLLVGDHPFAPADRTGAAEFLLQAASARTPGKPHIELVSADEERRVMRIAVINDDMPFLVDSVAGALAALGVSIERLMHPVVAVERDDKGRIVAIPKACPTDDDTACREESMIYIEAQRVDARARRMLTEWLDTVLADVRAAVEDWPALREAMQDDAERIADCGAEGAELLRWLDDGHLTQLGHLTRKRDGSMADKLGVCRSSAEGLLSEASFERAFDWFDSREACDAAPLVIKANRHANVHRRVPLDLFIVPRFADDDRENGKVVALSIHAGVWTSAGLSAPPDQVPRMRLQLANLARKLGLDPRGHAGKALVHVLTTLPHDLVIGFAPADIERVATIAMRLVDRPRPRLALVEAPLSRHLFAFVWLPRDLMSTTVRQEVAAMLEEAAEGQVLDWALTVEGGQLATLRFVLDIRDGDEVPDQRELEQRLETMLLGWGEAVEHQLATEEEPRRAAALASRYADSFPTHFRSHSGPAEAARDILRLRNLATGEGESHERDARLYDAVEGRGHDLRLKIYQAHGAMPLSDAVPALENFGFRVLEEVPTALADGKLGTIHDFGLAMAAGQDPAPVLERAEAVERAIAAVLNGGAENDSFNRLVTAAGLSEREADWMRAMYRYIRQGGFSYTIYTVVDALERAPEVTHGLVALMRARHDPAFDGDREDGVEKARTAIRNGLAKVDALNDDRLLRRYLGTIEAILRTNAFAPAGVEALAFKFDSALVPGLPRPLPWREIFVYSRRVEGIHLRAGPVARGGLRWSDRRDDFRTEVLGLMKAQRVKNAVIVPTGAKGGFYPKQLPDPALDRDAWAVEGKESYKVFIRALLSLTDNIVEGEIVHPDGVVINDGDDPYFVVAADKGTATFSDTANALAEERDFWLDDAFASGGSNGYDHKAMGITAKGAWISVQRHFRELGVDVQTESVDVVGCGDMSGDVFGNGMLLSKAIRLIAAFDHRHIFIDPDPDPAASWKERKRLFELDRSSWADYNSELISRGGGVFSRKEKRIKLSKVAAKALGIETRELEPEALISAILKAPADLLWFGGIGTYVKATGESDTEVGDPANDALRVNGPNLRVKVVGEGANLGMTQAGRIEFALQGGRLNTDFIDNSAGVDCSDNEVNIKIALAAAKRDGTIDEDKRNALLRRMTDDVADLVLEDNRLQALALSIAELHGARATAAHVRLIETLEERGQLDRETEGLALSEQLGRRAAEGQGLTRPELAVLLSSTKLAIQDALEASDVPADPAMEPLLFHAFPDDMRDKFATEIEEHRLRRELISTKLANRVINRMGVVHPFELAEEEGVTLCQVAAAFVAVERLFDLSTLWDALETAKMPEDARLALFDRTAIAVRSHMADALRAGSGGGTLHPAAMVDELAAGVGTLADELDDLLGRQMRDSGSAMEDELIELGAPAKLAHSVVRLFELDGAIGIARLSTDADIAPLPLTRAFIALGQQLGLDWAQSSAAVMNPSDPWERLLVAGLARDFQQMRLDFLRRLSRRKAMREEPVETVSEWVKETGEPVRQFRALIERARAAGTIAPAMLAQVASQARNLLGR